MNWVGFSVLSSFEQLNFPEVMGQLQLWNRNLALVGTSTMIMCEKSKLHHNNELVLQISMTQNNKMQTNLWQNSELKYTIADKGKTPVSKQRKRPNGGQALDVIAIEIKN